MLTAHNPCTLLQTSVLKDVQDIQGTTNGLTQTVFFIHACSKDVLNKSIFLSPEKGKYAQWLNTDWWLSPVVLHQSPIQSQETASSKSQKSLKGSEQLASEPFHASHLGSEEKHTKTRVQRHVAAVWKTAGGEERQKVEDTLTGCSGGFGQCCRLEQTLTDRSKTKSSIWFVSVGHYVLNHSKTPPPHLKCLVSLLLNTNIIFLHPPHRKWKEKLKEMVILWQACEGESHNLNPSGCVSAQR